MSYQCEYCYNFYSSQSGLSRHRQGCRERIRYEHETMMEILEDRNRRENNRLMKIIQSQSNELEKLRDRPTTIINNTLNVERMEIYNNYFDRCQTQLIEFTRDSTFDESNVLDFLREMKQKLLTSGTPDDLALVWALENPNEDIPADTPAESEHLSDKVNEVEEAIVEVIKPKLIEEVQDDFEEAVDKYGLFGIL